MSKKGFVVAELVMCAAIVGLLAAMIILPIISCKYEARLYNEKYGTHYNACDFIFAGKTIKIFLNGGPQTTQNININGAIPVKVQS